MGAQPLVPEQSRERLLERGLAVGDDERAAIAHDLGDAAAVADDRRCPCGRGLGRDHAEVLMRGGKCEHVGVAVEVERGLDRAEQVHATARAKAVAQREQLRQQAVAVVGAGDRELNALEGRDGGDEVLEALAARDPADGEDERRGRVEPESRAQRAGRGGGS